MLGTRLAHAMSRASSATRASRRAIFKSGAVTRTMVKRAVFIAIELKNWESFGYFKLSGLTHQNVARPSRLRVSVASRPEFYGEILHPLRHRDGAETRRRGRLRYNYYTRFPRYNAFFKLDASALFKLFLGMTPGRPQTLKEHEGLHFSF